MTEARRAAAEEGRASWQPGTTVVQENYYAGHVITVFPIIVVRDEPDFLALYTAAGSTRVDGAMRDRPSIPLASRMEVYLDPDPQPLSERPVRANVLTFNIPNAHHSIWLFWTAEWEFRQWYVNLQWPYERTDRGIANGRTRRGDLFLDLVVHPDLSWSWKDRDEFDAAHETGLLSDDERDLALAEAHRVIGRIEHRAAPFNEPWPDWRPDPAWPIPHLRLTGARAWALASPESPPKP